MGTFRGFSICSVNTCLRRPAPFTTVRLRVCPLSMRALQIEWGQERERKIKLEEVVEHSNGRDTQHTVAAIKACLVNPIFNGKCILTEI